MGDRRLLDLSPTGVQHSVEVVDDGDAFLSIEHTPTSVEKQILDDCARLRSLHQRRGAQFQHAARIPILTYEMWRDDWAKNFADKMTWQQYEVAKLNSRDNCQLRTGNGRSVYGKRL